MAGLQGDDALAHGVDHLAVVRRHDDGGAGAVDHVEQLHDAQRDGRVEVARRLVADEQRRAVNHGPGNGHALLLATGELVGEVLHALTEANKAKHLGDLRLDDGLGLADALEGEGDVLVDRLVGKQLEVLVDGADLTTKIRDLAVAHLGEVLAGNDHLPLGGAQLARDEAQEG